MIWLYPNIVKGVTHHLGQFQKIDHEDHFFLIKITGPPRLKVEFKENFSQTGIMI